MMLSDHQPALPGWGAKQNEKATQKQNMKKRIPIITIRRIGAGLLAAATFTSVGKNPSRLKRRPNQRTPPTSLLAPCRLFQRAVGIARHQDHGLQVVNVGRANLFSQETDEGLPDMSSVFKDLVFNRG
jgi:hypothetical protein